jgi:phospholipid/cholesterol/gamma-HCH transport system permease protein
MASTRTLSHDEARLGRRLTADIARRLSGWWSIVRLAALLAVALARRDTWRREPRRLLAARLVHDTLHVAPLFIAAAFVLVLVLTRIVVATAQAYGLSQYALEMLIRVLVLELLPLAAALFVALRVSLAHGAALARARRRGELQALQAQGVDVLAREVLPRVLACVYVTITLAALAAAIALVLVYLLLHGATDAAFARYTLTFARVFSPAVTLVLVLKVLGSALAVALIPAAAGLYERGVPGQRASIEIRGLMRLVVVLMALELLSLIGIYY